MEKVSVIIPIYNSEKYLEDCLNSVVNQTYKNLEIICVDDYSKDKSISIIKKYKDKRIKIIKMKKNSGAGTCRNTGIDAATGDYICFLDSDDYWYLDKIEKQLKFIKDKAFIYSKYLYLRGSKTHIAKVPSTFTYDKLLKNTAIFTSTIMLNMKYLDKKDIYMPPYRMGQDYGAWYRIIKKVGVAYGMQEVLAVYRIRKKSLSSNKFKAMKRTWYLYKAEGLPLLKRIICFICYGYNAVKRRIS